MDVYCGIDIGASAAKLVLIDRDGDVLGRAMRRSGTNYTETAEACLGDAMIEAAVDRPQIAHTVSTGYGRNNVPWVNGTMTEIACHGKGAFHYCQKPITVIDIGAQDNKIIHLDETGRRTSFKMNRKCSAGTGAFVEEIAYRLNLPIEQLNGLAEASTEEVTLGSFCTVFAATEILEKIRAGEKVEDIVKGAFRSVARRVFEMDSIGDTLVLTGGVVAHNPILIRLIEESFAVESVVPPNPQYVGAFGAALFAKQNANKENRSC